MRQFIAIKISTLLYLQKDKKKPIAMKKKVMLDTNIFIKLNDANIDANTILDKFEVYSTNAQYSEFSNDNNINRRNKRLTFYEQINPNKLQLKSGIWVDKMKWDDSQIWIDTIGDIASKIKGQSMKENTIIDALIAESAGEENIILVTDEDKIIKRAKLEGIEVLNYSDFRRELDV